MLHSVKMADVIPETHDAWVTDLEQLPATEIQQLHPHCSRPPTPWDYCGYSPTSGDCMVNLVTILYTSWNIGPRICTSGWWQSCFIYQSPGCRRVSSDVPLSWCASKILGTVGNLVYITFELWHPIYIRCDCRHFEFLWALLKIMRCLRHQKNVLVIHYRLVKTAWKNSNHFRKCRGCNICTPRHSRNQETVIRLQEHVAIEVGSNLLPGFDPGWKNDDHVWKFVKRSIKQFDRGRFFPRLASLSVWQV